MPTSDSIDMLASNYDMNTRQITSCMYHETGTSEIDLQQLFDVKSPSSCSSWENIKTCTFISHYISAVYATLFNHDKPTRFSKAFAVRATFLTSTSSAVSMTSFHTRFWQNCSRFLGGAFAFWRLLRLT